MRADQDLQIHDEIGLTGWDGEYVHYGDVVEVLCADGEPCERETGEHETGEHETCGTHRAAC